jgi:2-aminoadipate transaminase
MASQYPQYEAPPVETMLALGVGQPSVDYLSGAHKLVSSALTKPNDDPELFQYGNKPGQLSLRNEISKMLCRYTKDNINPKNLYVTNGVSQAVFMLASLFKIKATYVMLQDPTYFIMLNTFIDLGYTGLAFDLANYDSTHDTLTRLFGQNPYQHVIMYIVPFHQNPTGKCITPQEKLTLKSMCKIFPNLLVISDETYQMLSFDNTTDFPSLASPDVPNIVAVGTFSKILAPALRLGWMTIHNDKLITQLNNSGFMDSGGGVNPVIGLLVENIIKSPQFNENLDSMRTSLRVKCEYMKSVIERYSDLFDVSCPTGGYFLWVKSKTVSALKVLEIANKHKMSFHVGSKFSIAGNHADCFRLSFSYYSLNHILAVFAERFDLIARDIVEYNNVKNVDVYVLGGRGKLGTLIVEECAKCGYNPIVLNDMNFSINKLHHNVFVDVSSPTGTKNLITALFEKDYMVPLIIGTTGDLPTDLIEEYGLIAPVTVVPNFSIGVTMLYDMLKHVPANYWNCHIEDIHHTKKLDAPSGTAKALANAIKNSSDISPQILSSRIGDVVGTHHIHFYTENEEVTISHVAKDRRLFAVGCVRLIKEIFE